MQFALKASDFEGLTGCYVVLTRHCANGTVDVLTIPQADWTVSGNFYIVAYSGIAAKEMGDVIEAVVYNAADEAISELRAESIETYALSMLGKTNVIANAEQRTMFVDLLNYGAEAQKTFNYNNTEEGLVTYGVNPDYMALVSAEVPSIENEEAVDRTGFASYMQYSALMAESNIQMAMRFKLPSTNPEAYEARITYGGNTVVIDGAYFRPVSGYASYWTVVFDQLPAKEARQAIQITMYEKASGTAVSPEYSMSIENVAYDKIEGNADFVYALMRFSDAAKAYFG
jgi:hypothetical protein